MMINERKLIGKGRVSSIYSDGQKAYKTYPTSYPFSWIKHEFEIQAEITSKTKLPVLRYELLENDREIKMDIIAGLSLADRMRKQKYPNGLIDLVDLQVSTYEYSSLELSDSFEDYKKYIKNSLIDESLKAKALDSLSCIKKMSILCHFDFHFENVMFDGEKYYIIDWVNAKLGNPVMDIARTYIILKQYAMRLAGVFKANY